MDVGLASWLVIAIAVALANLPFLNESVFGLIALPRGERGPTPRDSSQSARTKSFVVRLLELFVLYFVVGALALALEARIGNVFAQTWEFYAITGCLFVVLGFPGFTYRYLRKRR